MEMIITFPGGMRVDAAFGDHVVQTDQPILAGGEGAAPTPFALFLASIGTCAGIFVLSFCKQRNIPTEDIRIRQRMEFDLETHMVRHISLDIFLPPTFPSRYSRALVRIVELCSVKKHLENPPDFSVETHIAET